MLHVSGGTTIKRGSSIPAPGTKMGSHSALSAEIKKHVSIPVATVGRITEPWLAEELLENDKADICMIGRANLCEPEFCNKAQAGHEEDIRPCIGCLRCLNGIMFGKRVACTVNPSLEPENEDTITPAKETKNVLVIGGGPAGMEAAYVAAKRGHHVVLADRQDSLGGTVRIAAVPIAKQDLTQLIKYQAHKLEQAGVKVLLNTEVTLETIQKDYPDYEVILCAGATPVVPQFMTQFKDWMTADDVLYGRKFPGRKIVVIGGGSVGCETADYLAPVLNDRFPRNREITLIEMAHEIMEAESGPGRSLLVQRMMEKGIQILCDAKVEEVNHTVIKYTKDGKTHEITDADTLVLAMGYRPSNTLEEQLTSAGITCHVLGDCKKPGNIKDAVTEGYQTALNL
jgi:NADPH-dependent 2,4-dienoyl-CoA reductase/sulfur reductase-like enzyme